MLRRECAQDTGRWTDKTKPGSHVWLNDRDSPRIYDRNFVSARTKQRIDDVLKLVIPQQFAQRVEPTKK